MTDGVHLEFDTDAGHMRLLCDRARFEHLSGLVRDAAGVSRHFFSIPAADVRIVSVELVGEEESPPGWGKQMLSVGCAVALMGIAIVFAVGALTVGKWLMQ
jgi:hypothetical protein